PDPAVGGLVERVGGERGRYEDHRGVRAFSVDGLGDRVVDGDAVDVLPALAGRDSGDDLGAIGPVPQAVEAPLGAGQPLDDEPRLLVDDDRHYRAASIAIFRSVSRPSRALSPRSSTA